MVFEAPARGRILSALMFGIAGSACTGVITSPSDTGSSSASGGAVARGASGAPATLGSSGSGTLGTAGTAGMPGAPGAGGTASMPGVGSGGAGLSNGSVAGAGTTATTGGAASTACATPSAVPFRPLARLNRAEYDNTVRDLLGDVSHAALTLLPADFGDGAFDNNAAALSISPALAANFAELAETLAENALAANSPGRKLILICSTADTTCARQIGDSFAAKAWRRPLAAGESDRLFALYTATRAAGFTHEQGVQMMVEGALTSPNFLFRPEIDPTPDSTAPHAIGPYELASRLSYFLWSSMPDSTLQSAAAAGQLSPGAGLTAQLQRMWSDPKAEAFYSRFPGLWLRTLNVSIAKVPSSTVFPAFDATLETAMEAETATFMRDFVTGDVNFLDFINAKYTYVNQRLAQFYGISGQFTSAMTRVDLSSNAQRGGILTQGSFLTVTSMPERTSPVLRGAWVLARLLASPPPPPPANVPPIEAVVSSVPLSMRQKMAEHATNPACAGCHTLMDPIGFGLENFDGIGQWRTLDNGVAVDASGVVTGQPFNGAKELAQILRTDSRVPRAVAQYLASYALGREMGPDDQCTIDALASAFQSQDNGRMSALVARVASLDLMRTRSGAP